MSGAFSARRPMVLGLLGVLILLGGFGTWSVTAEISGAIIAPGQIQVERNRQVVQHPDGGVVAEVLVQEGDTVAADTILLTLDDTSLSSELAVIESQLWEVLARRARLEVESAARDTLSFDPELEEEAARNPEAQDLMLGQAALFEARRDTINQQIEQLGRRQDQIKSQIDGTEAQLEGLSRQLELIGEELEDQQTLLDRGLAQASRVLALQREEANLAGEVGELQGARAQSEGRITETQLEILRLEAARREEAIGQLRDLRIRELELREQRGRLQVFLGRLDVRAPVAGVIYDQQVFGPQSVVSPAEPILFLVPQDRPLVIAAEVDPIHVDQVFPGQDVTLRFSTLDQRQTPELFGRVLTLSPDAFVDQTTGRSFYRAEVVMNEGEVEKLPQGTDLIPGMPVETFIKTSDRTPMGYLVKPLTDYFAKAFREG